MDDIETVLTCPLGSECREVKDGKVHQCIWFVKMKGVDSQGDEHDKWNCSMAWMPILQTETSSQIVGTNASIQSMRNLSNDRQKEAIAALEKHGAS